MNLEELLQPENLTIISCVDFVVLGGFVKGQNQIVFKLNYEPKRAEWCVCEVDFYEMSKDSYDENQEFNQLILERCKNYLKEIEKALLMVKSVTFSNFYDIWYEKSGHKIIETTDGEKGECRIYVYLNKDNIIEYMNFKCKRPEGVLKQLKQNCIKLTKATCDINHLFGILIPRGDFFVHN